MVKILLDLPDVIDKLVLLKKIKDESTTKHEAIINALTDYFNAHEKYKEFLR